MPIQPIFLPWIDGSPLVLPEWVETQRNYRQHLEEMFLAGSSLALMEEPPGDTSAACPPVAAEMPRIRLLATLLVTDPKHQLLGTQRFTLKPIEKATLRRVAKWLLVEAAGIETVVFSLGKTAIPDPGNARSNAIHAAGPPPEPDPGLGSTSARHVLLYFTYHLETTDPRNKTLLGQWRLEGRQERIDLTFSHDQTFVASAFSRPRCKHEEPRHLWDGQGRWAVRDGKLSIMRTHSREGLTWRENRRELFRNKRIVETTPSEIVLEDGPFMKRPSFGSVESSSEAGNP